MGFWELFIIALGLSMDAFAVSVCKGLSVPTLRPSHSITCGAYFGVFQGLMPLLGWILGVQFQGIITRIDHWIAFGLLGLIGLNMARESRSEEDGVDSSFTPRAMLPLAVATSIDALAVGVTFAFLQVQIFSAVTLIGVTTFVLCAIGTRLGSLFGSKLRARAQLLGGLVLIGMGAKILVEHLGLLG